MSARFFPAVRAFATRYTLKADYLDKEVSPALSACLQEPSLKNVNALVRVLEKGAFHPSYAQLSNMCKNAYYQLTNHDGVTDEKVLARSNFVYDEKHVSTGVVVPAAATAPAPTAARGVGLRLWPTAPQSQACDHDAALSTLHVPQSPLPQRPRLGEQRVVQTSVVLAEANDGYEMSEKQSCSA